MYYLCRSKEWCIKNCYHIVVAKKSQKRLKVLWNRGKIPFLQKETM